MQYEVKTGGSDGCESGWVNIGRRQECFMENWRSLRYLLFNENMSNGFLSLEMVTAQFNKCSNKCIATRLVSHYIVLFQRRIGLQLSQVLAQNPPSYLFLCLSFLPLFSHYFQSPLTFVTTFAKKKSLCGCQELSNGNQ